MASTPRNVNVTPPPDRLPATAGKFLPTSCNRAEYFPERRVMMQQWADMLAALIKGAQVIPYSDARNKRSVAIARQYAEGYQAR